MVSARETHHHASMWVPVICEIGTQPWATAHAHLQLCAEVVICVRWGHPGGLCGNLGHLPWLVRCLLGWWLICSVCIGRTCLKRWKKLFIHSKNLPAYQRFSLKLPNSKVLVTVSKQKIVKNKSYFARYWAGCFLLYIIKNILTDFTDCIPTACVCLQR